MHIFQKSRSQYKILDTKGVMWSMQIVLIMQKVFGATIENLVA
jgi:hypothetical protein